MDDIVYDNGSFYVYRYSYRNNMKNNDIAIAYGIKRSGQQNGMLFSHPDKDFCIAIADRYKKSMKAGINYD